MSSFKAEILNKEPNLLRGCQLNTTEFFIGKKAYAKTLKPGSILNDNMIYTITDNSQITTDTILI